MKNGWMGMGLVAVAILFFLSLVVKPGMATVLPFRKLYKQIVYTCYTVTSYLLWVDRYEQVK